VRDEFAVGYFGRGRKYRQKLNPLAALDVLRKNLDELKRRNIIGSDDYYHARAAYENGQNGLAQGWGILKEIRDIAKGAIEGKHMFGEMENPSQRNGVWKIITCGATGKSPEKDFARPCLRAKSRYKRNATIQYAGHPMEKRILAIGITNIMPID
jgi:hypothetical protein